jgi:hypothetical protein
MTGFHSFKVPQGVRIAMRSEPLPSDIPLPARDPRGPRWNRLRSALFFSHALPAHAKACLGRPRLHPSPAIESPHFSSVRSSECVAGSSFHRVAANNLAKLATSRPAYDRRPLTKSKRPGPPRWPMIAPPKGQSPNQATFFVGNRMTALWHSHSDRLAPGQQAQSLGGSP